MPNLASVGRGVDDVYVNVYQPQPVIGLGGGDFSGAAPGMGCWGQPNVPVTVSSPQEALLNWGTPINSGRDLVQDAALFFAQFPLGSFTGVRVTDGTDTQAVADFVDSNASPVNGLVLKAKYTGTFGNQIKATLSTGSNYSAGAPTWKVAIKAGTRTPEVYDRIPGATANAAWTNIMNAINNGQGANNPASAYVVAALPNSPSTSLPPTAAQTVTLTGGSDGGVVTTAEQIGVDGGAGARTGLYALRGCGAVAFWLAGQGATDNTGWATVLTFAKSEDAISGCAFPSGTSVASAVASKLAAGIDDPYCVMMLSQVTYLDTYLNQSVTLPATPVLMGVVCSIKPHESPGNRKVYGIQGTEQTLGVSAQPFSKGDLDTLEANGINAITPSIPGARAFGIRHGKNTSSNFATSEIPYATKTNQLVRDFSGPVMGQFINRLQTTRQDDPLRSSVEAAFNDYLGPQETADEIDTYTATCDLTNNTPASIKAGQLRADVIVAYLSVVDQFIINLTAGQTVDVQLASAVNGTAPQLQ